MIFVTVLMLRTNSRLFSWLCLLAVSIRGGKIQEGYSSYPLYCACDVRIISAFSAEEAPSQSFSSAWFCFTWSD